MEGHPKRGRQAGRGSYGGESERVNLNTESSDVLLLKLSSQVALDEGGLYRWTVGQHAIQAGREGSIK